MKVLRKTIRTVLLNLKVKLLKRRKNRLKTMIMLLGIITEVLIIVKIPEIIKRITVTTITTIIIIKITVTVTIATGTVSRIMSLMLLSKVKVF